MKRKMLPTPVASDSPAVRAYKIHPGKRRQIHLPEALARYTGRKGRLNLSFVEQMMGYPAGWTQLTESEMIIVRSIRKQTSA